MATYRYLKCPHCHKNLGMVKSTNDLGNPFKQCPSCRGTYIDPNTSEWVTKSPFQRFMFFLTIPLTIAVAVLAVGAVISIIISSFAGGNTAFIIGLCVSLVIAIGLFVLLFIKRKSNQQEAIKKSLERTKSESYVNELKKTRLKFYPIEGVEIGTIKDASEQ